jgi:hypothetical protein
MTAASIRRRVGGWFGPVEPSDCQGADGTSDEGNNDGDNGRAIIEVIFLAVLMLIPVVYILISLLRLQSATFAVTQAARDAGRAVDAAPDVDEGIARAGQIAAIDLADQNFPNDQITLQFVAPGADCHDSTPVTPTLDAGAVYDICVTAVVSLPGVPTVLTGNKNTVTGVYTVHIGDLREGR